MSKVFKHTFASWCVADAVRWTNPDGSEGGIVAVEASVGEGVHLPADVVVWPNAKISKDVASIGEGASIGYRASIGGGASVGDRASIGDGAVIEKDDWFFVAGPQGSRNAWATAVWSPKHELRWWLGCQHGITTETLRERISTDHAANPHHREDYHHLIEVVLTHPGLRRAREIK